MCWSSTTRPLNARLMQLVLRPEGYRSPPPPAGRGPGDAGGRRLRPGDAGCDDARHVRLRGLPGDPRPARTPLPAGGAGHRAQGRGGAGARHRGRGRRFHLQAVQRGGAAGAGPLAAADQGPARPAGAAEQPAARCAAAGGLPGGGRADPGRSRSLPASGRRAPAGDDPVRRPARLHQPGRGVAAARGDGDPERLSGADHRGGLPARRHRQPDPGRRGDGPVRCADRATTTTPGGRWPRRWRCSRR